MRLTSYTDYTLRTLIYLALCPNRLATIATIAESYGISENHLMKVVHRLGLEGYVETVRGRNGGMRLAKLPEDINVGKVVRRMEPDMELVACFAASNACTIQPGCVLKGALVEALDAFLAVLDRYTLADLIGPKAKLSGLLKNPRRRRSEGRPASDNASASARRDTPRAAPTRLVRSG